MYIEMAENPHKCGMCHKENIEVKPLYKTFKIDDDSYSGEFLNIYLCEECINELISSTQCNVEIQSVDGVLYSVIIDKLGGIEC